MGRLALALSLCVAAPAAAQPDCPPDHVGCDAQDADWHHRNNTLFDDLALDTGFVPAGAPIQLRIQLFFGGGTEVDLGGSVVTSWPPPLSTAVHGRVGTGRLGVDYGFELRVTLRFDIEVAGARYRWEGDIPIPLVPEDLRVAGDTLFDPFLLPDRDDAPARVGDTTDRFSVASVDLAGGLIPLPGVSGGLAIDMQAALEASYRTERVVIVDAPASILTEGGSVVVGPDMGVVGFGGAKDLRVHPVGTLGHAASFTFWPTIFIDIVGTRTRFDLAEIPLELPEAVEEITFEDESVHVPLPDVEVRPTEIAFGELVLGEEIEQTVAIANRGEAPLDVVARTPDAPFVVTEAPLSLRPGEMGWLTVRFRPDDVGPSATLLLLGTNDPDEPLVAVRLRGDGLAPPEPDAGGADAGAPDAAPSVDAGGAPGAGGGCGCALSAPGGGGAVALALALVLVRRRRAEGRGSADPRAAGGPSFR